MSDIKVNLIKARDQEVELLFSEMRRTLILLDSIKGKDLNPWQPSGVAELKAKFHEIRRDTIRFEKDHLNF
jgi:hypothetical protein